MPPPSPPGLYNLSNPELAGQQLRPRGLRLPAGPRAAAAAPFRGPPPLLRSPRVGGARARPRLPRPRAPPRKARGGWLSARSRTAAAVVSAITAPSEVGEGGSDGAAAISTSVQLPPPSRHGSRRPPWLLPHAPTPPDASWNEALSHSSLHIRVMSPEADSAPCPEGPWKWLAHVPGFRPACSFRWTCLATWPGPSPTFSPGIRRHPHPMPAAHLGNTTPT